MSLTAHTIDAQHIRNLKVTIAPFLAETLGYRGYNYEFEIEGSTLYITVHTKQGVNPRYFKVPKLLPIAEVPSYFKYNYPELFI